jgi:hypothetical protein
MNSDWESTFNSWSKPPSQSEADRIENAVSAVRKALDADDFLAQYARVFVQGSYRNRVNVRQESDVDIGVLYTGDTFYPKYPLGKTDKDFRNVDATYNYAAFKNSILSALTSRFGNSSVSRGNKAFDVHANSYRVDADVVPLFVHRRYSEDGSYVCGVQINADDGSKIVNWPERLYDDPHWPNQHYENGVAKNAATARTYKGVARILKKLKYLMAERGIPEAKAVPGFLVECLAWNVPNSELAHNTWDQNVQAALLHLWSNTKTIDSCNEWGEVNELKYLFRGSPAPKLQQAHAFVNAAWDHIGIR